MCYLNPQDEIKDIMIKNGITYQWIADRLGTYYQKIEYAIKIQKELPLSMYSAIMGLFEKHGYIVSSKEACHSLIELTFKTNAKFGNEIKKINDQISEDIKDNTFSPEERLRMRYKLEEVKREFNESIDALIKLTEAK